MTAPDPEWVEAGAQAIDGEEATTTSGYYGASYRVDSEHAADLAAAVIAAVESLVRAHGFQEGYDAAMTAAGEMIGRRIREQIAADIEAGCVHGRLVKPDMQGVMVNTHETCYRCQHAARIARGGAQ